MRVGASWLFAPAREPFQHNILICERRDEQNHDDDRDSNSRSLLATVTTNATRLTLASYFLRRTVHVTTGTSTRRGGESGFDSDITQRGEVGVGEEAARAGHRRRRHRCAPCLSRASTACSLGGHGGARWRRGGTASPRQVRSARCRCAGAAPAASLCSLRTHARRVRGAFSRHCGYVGVTRAAVAVGASSDAVWPRRCSLRRNGPLGAWRVRG